MDHLEVQASRHKGPEKLLLHQMPANQQGPMMLTPDQKCLSFEAAAKGLAK